MRYGTVWFGADVRDLICMMSTSNAENSLTLGALRREMSSIVISI